jgi:arylsulfatase A-like enzyme
MIRLLMVAAALAAACGKNGGGTSDPKGGGGGSTAVDPGPKVKPPARAPSRGPEHAVYSLADNRLAAHRSCNGGLYVPAGSIAFAKYVRFGNTLRKANKGWELRQSSGDIKVAKITGNSAKIEVPLTAADLQQPVIRIHAHNDKPDARAISARVNGNKDINGQLAPGWGTVELAVPAGQLKEGENEILFFVGGGAGLPVRSIQIGGAAAAQDELASKLWSDDKKLLVPQGCGLSWYVSLPEKALVTADLDDGACEITVTATGDDGKTATGKLAGLGSAVELGSLAGKAARLDLAATGTCPVAKLGNAALVVPGAAAAAPARGEAPQYVILFIMDSLRADRVKAFDADARPSAPTFDKLAETSALFVQNYVQGNESRVSHASIWSSLYPIKHKMIGEKDRLALEWKTVDEVAKEAGRYVAGVSSNGYVRPKRGFGSAWDRYSNHIEEELGLKAEDILEKGMSFVDGKKEPWFLYLGTVDTHVTWRAKQPWIEQYDPGYKGRFAESFGGDDAGAAASGKLTLTDREIQHVRALYDSNVSYQDDILRQLIEKLEAAGMWDKTMLIITADHGDEQWEDGRVGHGASTRDMLIHVPLLVHYPPLVGAGKRTEGTEVIDIVPTIADALGVAIDPEWQGESLIPLSHGVGGGYPRLSFNSMYEDQHAGRIGRWKVRVSSSKTRIYDLGADKDEMKDIAGTPAAAIGGRAVLDPLWMLRALNLEWKKSQWGNAANVSARFASDLGE